MALTKKQMEIIRKFWKKGEFRSWDMSGVFSSSIAREECIKTLMVLGIVEEKNFIYYLNREKFLEHQEEHFDETLEKF